MDKTPPSSAGDSSSIPSLGVLTSLRATKPVHHNYWNLHTVEPALHKRSHHNEKPAHHEEEQPLLAAPRESLCSALKTQYSQKQISMS